MTGDDQATRKTLGDGLRLATGTLTALRVAAPSTVDRPRARAAMLLAPAVGLLPGTIAAAVTSAVLILGLDHLVAAVLAVGTLALATRGLHLDGLADTADGFAASYDRTRSLAVMRSGDSGPAGVATVVLVLAIQTATLAQALRVVGPVAVVVAALAGRLTLPVMCARGVPAARSEGLGAAVAGSVPRALAAAVTTATATVGAGLTAIPALWPAAVELPVALGPPAAGDAVTVPLPPQAGTAMLFGTLAVLASVPVTALLAGRAVRRFGGVTGDVLGAGVEAGTATALAVLALLPR
jgi:adenosylcobinamide-GDP ribazoletransferase